jgi:hypothetical protein
LPDDQTDAAPGSPSHAAGAGGLTAAHKYGKGESVKTTLEIADDLFRRAKATAALRGESLKDFGSEALQAHLEQQPPAPRRPAVGEASSVRRAAKKWNRSMRWSGLSSSTSIRRIGGDSRYECRVCTLRRCPRPWRGVGRG